MMRAKYRSFEKAGGRGSLWMILLVMCLASLLAGAYLGRWGVKNQVSPRLKAEWARLWSRGDLPALADGSSDWVSRPTMLARLETRVIYLPGSDGNGGSIFPLSGDRLAYVTRTGSFGVMNALGVARPSTFKIDMALDKLLAHPVSRVDNFQPTYFRVQDLHLIPLGANRFELLVSHHFMEARQDCIVMRLSRAEVEDRGEELVLATPFRTLLSTTPCITFNPEGRETFQGHFSGGRIVRLGPRTVLLSTGDHGWVGLRGQPAVSQDDASTLGKLLRVDLDSGTYTVFAKGMRNPQGLLIDSKQRVWATEHGPRGGDELNLVVDHGNYGWPYATLGTDYGPRPWPYNQAQGRHEFGTAPRFAWLPSIGVSNLLEVTGNEFDVWRGDLLVLSLSAHSLHRLRLDGDRVVYDEPISFAGNRLRNAVQMSSGRIAILTDHGTVILLRNADGSGNSPYLDPASQVQRTPDMSSESRRAAVAGRFARTGPQLAEEGSRRLLAQAPVEADKGRTVFARHCSICHSVMSDEPGIGPGLNGVVGRRIGATSFAYSPALAGQAGKWTSTSVVDFAVDPSSRYPGSIMNAVNLTSDERRDLVSYFDAIADRWARNRTP